MIRHWCEAIGDRNPVYTDSEFASASTHGGIVAPPTMLQAWTMRGLRAPDPKESEARARAMQVFEILDAAGFTSVVATNCTQEYARYLRPGDHLSVSSSIESVSGQKSTALGIGHFVTQRMVYTDQDGAEVATMRFRLLKFRPPQPARPLSPGASPAAPRPRPSMTRDTKFFWEGLARGQLLIQRCTCGRLRHPPGPMCPSCHSLEWDTVEASGRGTVYSYVVAHHPPVPPFEYPNIIVLVALEEGTRLVSNLVGIDPAEVRIGLSVRADFREVEAGLTLPLFVLDEVERA
jgi:uncharacterized OB-fold protein/acyl dehydratase